MKRRLLKLLLGFCTFVFVSSCGINNKDSYLKRFENYIMEIESTEKMSKDELTSVKKKYLDFTETYYNRFETELSGEDKELILELKARYYAVMAKQGLKDVGETLKDLSEQASEFINEILE